MRQRHAIDFPRSGPEIRFSTSLEAPAVLLTHTISHRSDPLKVGKIKANVKRATNGSRNYSTGLSSSEA